MPRRTRRLVPVFALVAAAAVWLAAPAGQRDAQAQTTVTVPANVQPESQHYDQGQIDWAFSSAGGFRTLRLTGKMDVTFGPLYVTVKTNMGSTVFLRENLRYAGPLTQTPEFGNQ